ncbi:secreted RxLR effector protein 161-like [Lactuca sativa]|uniref:secreted RxLR effector protein 161-like n=1 Tax=Lactuca sativa TaxID=4236 RepID=UPI000CD91B53|nr:secreted RxLR effector protein 161-like [Lactuca sativa]
MTTVRIMIAVAYVRHWKIFQMDLKNAFLNGDDHDGIESLKHDIAHRFAIKDLGLLRYFLGIESPTDGVPLSDPNLYRTVVGSLVYLTVTRPDIAHAVHVVSQFVTSPTSVHWGAVLRIMRYLHGPQFQTLLFPATYSLKLRAYSDADWNGDRHDRKSTTGFCVFLGESLISWKSNKTGRCL